MSAQSPFTCTKEELRWQTVIRKCACKSSWCPVCWNVSGKKALVERLRSLDPRRVRWVMLSIDRSKFKDGEVAFNTISEKRGVGNLLKNLQRTDGVKVTDWIAVLEWHKDGFPHWHLFIEVEQAGSAGMIGVDKIKARWPYGLWVSEGYIDGPAHWNNLTGYFNKHGYFEKGKGHQGCLPEWAKLSSKRIRRWAARPAVDLPTAPHRSDLEGSSRIRETYKIILGRCGDRTFIEASVEFKDPAGQIHRNVYGRYMKVPYAYLKTLYPWKYQEHLGLVLTFNSAEEQLAVLEQISQVEISYKKSLDSIPT